jgi:hypothetical protein
MGYHHQAGDLLYCMQDRVLTNGTVACLLIPYASIDENLGAQAETRLGMEQTRSKFLKPSIRSSSGLWFPYVDAACKDK